ncbi:polysaccharide biosynthesis family protein [Achromobacter sp. HZ01]|jgi:O-antigen/teichoic acid export membrane protein|uniref:Polysaccharide biosynthesis family protein n=1 Tax=Achromobacter pulmonis TaxID=1389932 RepID=A0A2N8KLS2_9BURK|nr:MULTISPECIES: oligosaccharide flippase family protein [Achromobacter]MBO9328852.1 oligosaccharide flippase family protein [Achromobacter xylosoxidans]PND34405.1 polysaccharide biosynthesis family protein [Achromobacter pulmonis]RAP64514.1 polysaccharide biosynthesis family protein [Achromobacter sp. HZ01]
MLGLLRKHIAGNASFWGLVEYGIGPVAALVALPILFRQLGTVGFGQYSMIIALAGFGNAANLGAAVTATKLVSERLHEPGGAYRAAGVSMSLIGCALGVVTLAALMLWGAVGLGWPDATFGGVAVTMLALPALAIYLTQQYDQLFSGCLKGREDFRATALCEVFSRSGTMALACATAWMTASPTWTGLAQALGLLLAGSVKMGVFSRAYGRLVVRPVRDRGAMMDAFRFSRWSWLNSLSALAFGSVDRVLVGSLMGPAALAIYTVGVQVGQIIHTASVAIFQKAMPRVSRLSASPPYPGAAEREIRRMMLWNLALSAGATIAVLAVSRPLLNMLLSASVAQDHLGTFQLLIIASGLLSLNAAAHFSLLGLGNSRAVAILNGLGGLAMLCVMAGLVQIAGEHAAAWGRMAYAAITLAGVAFAIRQSRPDFPGVVPAATR